MSDGLKSYEYVRSHHLATSFNLGLPVSVTCVSDFCQFWWSCSPGLKLNCWAQSGSRCAIYGSLVRAGIHGCLCNLWILLGCKLFHYSNPSLAQTYILTDWQPPLTSTIDITDCRRRSSMEHGIMAYSCHKIIRHVRFVPGWYFENSSPITYGNLSININS